MGKFGKLVLLLIIIAGAYFAFKQTGLIENEGVIGKIAGIDNKYGVSEAAIVPGEGQKTAQYLNEIAQIKAATGDEKALLELKKNLANMQLKLVSFAANLKKINLENINCAAAGPAAIAKKDANDATVFAKEAIKSQKLIKGNIEGFAYIKNPDFENSVNTVIVSLEEQLKILNQLC